MNLVQPMGESPFSARRRAGWLLPLALLVAAPLTATGCFSPGTKLHWADAESKDPGDRRLAKDVSKDVQQASLKAADPATNDPKAAEKSDDSLFGWWKDVQSMWLPKPPPPPVDSFVVRPDGLVPEKTPTEGTADARLAGARDLFRRADYAKAEALYHDVGQDAKAAPAMQQEGMYYEAECLRLQSYYPKAADTYNELLTKFSNTPYREQAVQHMYDIANYWLDDTRKEMEEWKEYQDGKRLFFWPKFVSVDRTKPVLDIQGRAVEKLEQVRNNDINGPLADKALFLAGSVKFYNGDYRDADMYFTQIHETHPNSKLAPQAVELAIIAKNMSTGGSDYDGRKAAEARRLVDSALRNYPTLANDPDKHQFLMRELAGVTLQQAEKDFKMAEFWKRTGHPGPAYFQFAVVRQRYPNTKYAEDAAKQMEAMHADLEKNGDGEPLPPLPGKPGALKSPYGDGLENAPQRPLPPGVLPPGVRE